MSINGISQILISGVDGSILKIGNLSGPFLLLNALISHKPIL